MVSCFVRVTGRKAEWSWRATFGTGGSHYNVNMPQDVSPAPGSLSSLPSKEKSEEGVERETETPMSAGFLPREG